MISSLPSRALSSFAFPSDLLPIDERSGPTSVLPRVLLGIPHDLISDLAKVVKLLSRQMEKLSPLVGIVRVKGSTRFVCRRRSTRGCGSVDELEDLKRERRREMSSLWEIENGEKGDERVDVE
jgi:hypothetical protein